MTPTTQTTTADIDALVEHPRNDDIYTDTDDVPELVADIRDRGFDETEPIEVVREPRNGWPANRVVSGHRRLAAARKVGLDEVPIREVEFDDANGELSHLLRKNNYRRKGDATLIREGAEYERLIREGEIEADGRVSDVVGERIGGMSGRTYEKGRKVMRAAEEGVWGGDGDDLNDDERELAIEQWEKLKEGDQSIHGAWSTVDEAIHDDDDGDAEEAVRKFSHDDDDDDESESGGVSFDSDTEFPITSTFPESYRDVIEQAAEEDGHDSLGDLVQVATREYLDRKGHL